MKDNSYVRGLVPPKGLNIDFKPSERQYEVWKALQPECPECGGTITHVQSGVDKNGNPTYKPKCSKCGNEDIPQIVLAGGAAGGGKMGLLDSLICTPFGFKKLRDIKVGSIITNPKTGGAQKVIWLHPIEQHKCYRVKFVDGTYFDCSEGHLWECHESIKTSERANNATTNTVWSTKSMFEWYKNKKNGVNSSNNLIIPLSEPVQFTIGSHKPPVNPYILGVIIGGGRISNSVINNNYVMLTIMDDEIVNRLKDIGYNISYSTIKSNSQAKNYYIKDKTLVDEIIKLSINGYCIPFDYKYSSIADRILLIQGLIDTGGCIDSRGNIIYTSTNKQLAEDIAFIVRSLGGIATIVKKLSGCKRNYVYDVKIATDNFGEFGKAIIDIEYIGIREGRCITVDDPSGLYVVNDFTVTHNSYLGSCWLISSCLRWPDMRMVVGRKTLKSLRESTWNTILTIVKDWGLIDGVNYKVNNISGEMIFYNGSKIIMKELCFQPADMQYLRFGSSEFSGAFIDEAGELDEKAVDVLFSRIRWNIPQSFVVPKMLLSTNPCLGWIRSRFVLDDDGNDVKCRQYERYIPYSIYDNPIAEFRMQYLNSLSRISDRMTRERLQYGNWQWVESNDAAAYWNFDGSKHLVDGLREKVYDPMKPLILSFDFNVSPYMSCLVIQIDYDNKIFYILEEILGKPKEKTNNTPALSKLIKDKLLESRHSGGIIITGDPAGKARSTQTEEGTNNFTIIMDNLQSNILRPKLKLLMKQPSQIRRLEFINELLKGYEGWKIQIDMRCRKFTEDMVYQKKNPDGTKSKAKVSDPDNPGSKFEKYGHLSDCFDMATCLFINEAWSDFQSSKQQIATTTATVYNEYDF